MNQTAKEVAVATTVPLSDVLGKITWEMHPERDIVSAGDRAELRRGRLGSAFWRVALRHLEPSGQLPSAAAPWRNTVEDRWLVVLRGIAETASLHRKGRRLGQAMAEAGVSEARLLRLLRATGEPLYSALRSVLRQLASAGQPFDWEEPAELVLYDSAHIADGVRRGIARDYYRATRRQG